jgi:hypothetical protein
MPRIRAAELWTLSRAGIYFVPDDAPRSLRYFDFSTRQIRPIFELDKDFESGLSISPDGRWVLYSQVNDVNGDIMFVDHFPVADLHSVGVRSFIPCLIGRR